MPPTIDVQVRAQQTWVQVQSMHSGVVGGYPNNAAGSLSFGLSDCYHPLYTPRTISGVNIFGDSVLDWMMELVECK